jgi:alanine racemase
VTSSGSRGAWVEVDLGALRENHRALRAALPSATGMGVVVKADGYGHGIEACARVAAEEGAALLAVATLDEGLALRGSGIEVPILVLYPVPIAAVAAAARAGLALTVGDPDYALALAQETERLPEDLARRPLEVHVEVDTGMSRGGIAPSGLVGTARALASSRRVLRGGTWSHLASPEDEKVAAKQVRVFEASLEGLRSAGFDPGVRHLASSGGLLRGTAPPYDLVRIGLAWYGVVAPEWTGGGSGLAARSLRPALSLRARPVRVAEVASGASVGYGGDWTASSGSRIATLPLGYADGVARSSWPGGTAIVRGVRVPFAGRVSMDAIGVDVTRVPDAGVEDEFILIGGQGTERILVTDVASQRGTIAWEVLTSLGPRLPRLYREGASSPGPLHDGTSVPT